MKTSRRMTLPRKAQTNGDEEEPDPLETLLIFILDVLIGFLRFIGALMAV